MSWANHYIEKLQRGETITFDAPNGNSMRPKIVPKQTVTVAPLGEGEFPEPGDILLCRVKGSQYLHLVSAVQGDRVQISNNHGRVNGWITKSGIYGKLVR
jgi:hypothetical protein